MQHGLRKDVMYCHDKRDGHKGVVVRMISPANKDCIA